MRGNIGEKGLLRSKVALQYDRKSKVEVYTFDSPVMAVAFYNMLLKPEGPKYHNIKLDLPF